MITIKVITEATDPIEVKVRVEDLIEETTLEVEASKVITMANFKTIVASIITPVEDITILIMGITGEEVVAAAAAIITEAVVVAEVIIEAITIMINNIMLKP